MKLIRKWQTKSGAGGHFRLLIQHRLVKSLQTESRIFRAYKRKENDRDKLRKSLQNLLLKRHKHVKKLCFSNLNKRVTVTTRTGRSMLLPWTLLFVRFIVNGKAAQTKNEKDFAPRK